MCVVGLTARTEGSDPSGPCETASTGKTRNTFELLWKLKIGDRLSRYASRCRLRNGFSLRVFSLAFSPSKKSYFAGIYQWKIMDFDYSKLLSADEVELHET